MRHQLNRARHATLIGLALVTAACGAPRSLQASVPAGDLRASGTARSAGDLVAATLDRADTNRDGALDGKESGLDAAQFQVLDRDRSGALERAEWQHTIPAADAVAMLTPFKPMVDATRRALDGDNDGRIDNAELAVFAAKDERSAPAQLVLLRQARQVADTDGDGAITADEFPRFYIALGAGSTLDMRGFFSKIVDALLGGYVSVTSRLAVGQAIHPARHKATVTPAKFGIPFEQVAFKSADGLTLKGWYIPAKQPTDRTVIELHGISDCRDMFVKQGQVAMLHPDYNQLVMDLRNHGESDGTSTSFAFHEGKDVQAAVNFLNARGPQRIAVYGISLGGATAIRGASIEKAILGVVDDCAYATVHAAFTGFISITFVPSPVLIASATLVRANKELDIDMTQTEPITQAASLAPRPLLVIHGAADRNIALENGRLIFDAAGNALDKEMWVAPGGGHAASALAQPVEYAKRLNAFFGRVFAAPRAAAVPGLPTLGLGTEMARTRL